VAGIKNIGDAGIRVRMTCVLTALNVRGLPALVYLVRYIGNVDGITLDTVRHFTTISPFILNLPAGRLRIKGLSGERISFERRGVEKLWGKLEKRFSIT